MIVGVSIALLFVVSGCGGSPESGSAPDRQARPTSSSGDDRFDAASQVTTTTDGPRRAQLTTTEPPVGSTGESETDQETQAILVGAEVLVRDDFEPLAGKRVGVVLNVASRVGSGDLLDVLVEAPEVDVAAVFAPEHGLRASDPAGEDVSDGFDESTGLVVHSLYGATKAPSQSALSELDILVFDLQDVGARFYTYVSTLGEVMQAAAEADLPVVVLDRPNPLGGDYVDGWTLELAQQSFVGRYKIPSVHGMTIGELAKAIQGEEWLPGLEDLELEIVPVEGWSRDQRWDDTGRPWTPPSPSLPTPTAALAYPGTVLFEATNLSVGRGTDEPFTAVGGAWVDGPTMAGVLNDLSLEGVQFEPITFTPEARPGVPEPILKGEEVSGVRLVIDDAETFRPVVVGIHMLDEFRRQGIEAGQGDVIDQPELLSLLAGTTSLLSDLGDGRAIDIDQVSAAWEPGLAEFEQVRNRYRLYE